MMKEYLVKQQAVFSISILLTLFTQAQTIKIKGTVRTSDGQPAAQVNIQLKEIKKIVASNEDGSYNIENVQAGNYTLIASFVGLQTQQKRIVVDGSDNSY